MSLGVTNREDFVRAMLPNWALTAVGCACACAVRCYLGEKSRGRCGFNAEGFRVSSNIL